VRLQRQNPFPHGENATSASSHFRTTGRENRGRSSSSAPTMMTAP